MAAEFSFQELLSPYDFEILVRDLLSRDLNIDLRAFAEGQDKGIDLRYAADPENMTIVQCKRRKDLSEKLLQSEAEKIAKLAAINYYLATSSELSVNKCDKILKIFTAWMKSDQNIYDKSRLNKLLQKYPEILRENYKLWINSSDIFDQFINNDLLGRSAFLIEDIRKDLKYYVMNEGYRQAVDILNHVNVVIISGIPGIGKTTMAKLLVWNYLQQGFDIADIKNVNDGERILKADDRKQVLYFDDFLGENFLQFDVIQGRANDLYMFIKRFLSEEVKNKKLIMTTREYILNQAKEKYEKLDRKELDVIKCIVDLGQYSSFNKAMILYNHLYYSNVSSEHIRALLHDKIYQKIITHPNYNPRIVETMTINLPNVEPREYAAEFIASLNDPTHVWNKAFESQISEYAKHLLYLLGTFEGSVLTSDLELAFSYFCNVLGSKSDLSSNPDVFRNSLKEVQDTFIRITLTKDKQHRVELINPSIRDFLYNRLVASSHVVKSLASSALFINQILYMYRNIIKDHFEGLTNIVIDRIINNWQVLMSSQLIQINELNNWQRDWIHEPEKIYLITTCFDLEKHAELRDLVLLKFDKLDISEFNHLFQYLRVLKVLAKYREFDGASIMKSYIDNTYVIDDVIGFKDFESIFPARYREFLSQEGENFRKIVNEIISEEISNSNTVDDLQGLISPIQDVERNFELSFPARLASVFEKIDELEDDLPTEHELREKSIYDKDDSAFDIAELFTEKMFDK